MNKISLNIGSGVYQIPLIKKLKSLKYKVISTDINPYSPGLKFADIKFVTDSYDYQRLTKLIKNKKLNPKIIVSGAARGCLLSASYLSKIFKLNYLNFKTALLLDQKNNLLEKYNKKIFLGKFSREALFKKKINCVLVLKIEGLSGADGIYKIKKKDEIKQVLKKFPNTKEFYLEKYVKAMHFTIVGQKNLSKLKIFAILKRKINNNFTTKEIKTFKISKSLFNKISSYVSLILDEIKFDLGNFSFEIFIYKNQIYLAEIEPSIPGSRISELITKCYKIDYLKNAIHLLESGKIINEKIKISRHGKIVFYRLKKPQKFSKIKFNDFRIRNKNFSHIKFTKHISKDMQKVSNLKTSIASDLLIF